MLNGTRHWRTQHCVVNLLTFSPAMLASDLLDGQQGDKKDVGHTNRTIRHKQGLHHIAREVSCPAANIFHGCGHSSQERGAQSRAINSRLKDDEMVDYRTVPNPKSSTAHID